MNEFDSYPSDGKTPDPAPTPPDAFSPSPDPDRRTDGTDPGENGKEAGGKESTDIFGGPGAEKSGKTIDGAADDDQPPTEEVSNGSYEIRFTAGKTDYSTGEGYNAYGFNANGSSRPQTGSTWNETPAQPPRTDSVRTKPPKKARGHKAASGLLIAACVLFALALILTLVAALKLREAGKVTLPPNSPTTGGAVAIENPPNVWVNPYALDTEDCYAAATAKTVDSVVVINAKSSAGISSGAGVIWAGNETDSYIITCNHVVEGTSEIQIIFNNDTSTYADLVGADDRTDIAILHVAVGDLSRAILPDDDYKLSLGQAVIVIGNPLGTLGNTVTNGILSSLSRVVTVENTTMELMQTNAAINSGNSGGGMFDLNGQLIGLVNAKVGGESVDNIGFAIPYTTMKTIAAELIEKGYVSGRPRLGVTTVTIDSQSSYNAAIAEYPDLESYVTSRSFFGTSITTGVYIVDASGVSGYKGSETLKFGDRVLAIGSASIASASDVSGALNNYNAGDTVQITVSRKGRTVVIEAILSSMEKD